MITSPITWAAAEFTLPQPLSVSGGIRSLADYPCDLHNARYPGSSCRVYLNIYREEETIQLKGSLCPDCLATIVTEWLSWALAKTPAGHWDPPAAAPELGALWMAPGQPAEARNGYRRH